MSHPVDFEGPSRELRQAIDEIDEALLSHNGTVWRYVENQLQYQFRDMPCWILLLDKARGDFLRAHDVYRDILLAHPIVFDELRMNVGFYAPYNDTHYLYGSLDDNDEIYCGDAMGIPLIYTLGTVSHERSYFSPKVVKAIEEWEAARIVEKARLKAERGKRKPVKDKRKSQKGGRRSGKGRRGYDIS